MDSEVDFAVGDVVQLKSGGPEMTIDEIDDYGFAPGGRSIKKATCVWFEGKKRQEGLFVLSTLQKVLPPGATGIPHLMR